MLALCSMLSRTYCANFNAGIIRAPLPPEVARRRKIHMYSMPYFTYGSTANFLFLGPTALIYISKERRCNENLCGVGNFKIE